MDIIAVYVPTQEDWDELTKLAGLEWSEGILWKEYQDQSCIYPNSEEYGSIGHADSQNWKIITLEQWKVENGHAKLREGVAYDFMEPWEQEVLKRANADGFMLQWYIGQEWLDRGHNNPCARFGGGKVYRIKPSVDQSEIDRINLAITAAKRNLSDLQYKLEELSE